MKPLFIYFFTIVGGIFLFQSCDSTTSPNDPLAEQPSFTNLIVSPNLVQFEQERDGFNDDTTITVSISAQLNIPAADLQPEYAVIDKASGNVVFDGGLHSNDSNSDLYSSNFEINTSTTSFKEYMVNVFIPDNPEAFAQSNISFLGFSNNPPMILETMSPDTIYRPESGEIPATFKAKVTDVDGQSTINRVMLRVSIIPGGEVQGSPFQMADDGVSFGDEVAADSVYTWSLPVTPTTNNPNRDFRIEFFAIDQAGLSSEIHRTTFSIRE